MKKLCALILALTLLLTNFSISVYALDSYADAKIDSNLTTALSESSSDTATAYVTMAGLDEDTFMAYFQEHYPVDYAVYMYAKYDIEPQLDGVNEITDEMIQTAIETKRAVYKQLNTKLSNEIISRYYGGDEVLFVSSYAPVAIVETDVITLRTASLSSSVASFTLCETLPSTQIDSSITALPGAPYYNMGRVMQAIDVANSISRADVVRDDKGMTGEGVKIGVVEADGVPYLSSPYLAAADITIRSGDTTVDDHATIVTSYLVASGTDGTPHGIVPDAEIYCCMAENNIEFYSAVEWLIDSGVNVINASMGFETVYGYYDYISAWIDHIAIEHDVHFVVASGNYNADENGNYVSSPAMAYNAISVGYFTSDGSSNLPFFTMSQSSACWEELPASTHGTRAEKPNIVAFGLLQDAISYVNSEVSTDAQGTSFASPQVAGVIAQLCDYTSGLKTKQTQVGAILSASAARKVDAVGTGEKGDLFISSKRVESNPQVSNEEGAGILDARWAWGIVVNHNHWSVNLSSASYSKTVTIDTSKNTLTRVAIFWLKRNTITETDHTSGTVDFTTNPPANLSLYVYAPDGSLLESSTLTYANFEIVQFVPPETGEYRIVITGAPSYSTNVGISLW